MSILARNYNFVIFLLWCNDKHNNNFLGKISEKFRFFGFSVLNDGCEPYHKFFDTTMKLGEHIEEVSNVEHGYFVNITKWIMFLGEWSEAFSHKDTSKWFCFFPVRDIHLRFTSLNLIISAPIGHIYPILV